MKNYKETKIWFKKPLYWIPGLILAVAVLIEAAAWNIQGFSDWYIRWIFPVWEQGLGSLTSLFPFSVGEILLGVGIVLVVAALLISIGAAAGWSVRFLRRQNQKMEKAFFRTQSFIIKYFVFLLWTTAIVSLIMVLNCFILYQGSTFSDRYGIAREEHPLEQLTILRNYVVDKVNTYAAKMPRDDQGELIYQGTENDMIRQARISMKNLGETYPALSGYYVTPKWMKSSVFLSQQRIMGYYFPFTMEANLNQIMYVLNKPSTLCHELAHTKGFIYENEANFIGYLACVNSQDTFFQYSGYMGVLNYIDNDFYNSIGKDAKVYGTYPQVSSQARADDIFLTDKAWEEVNSKAVLPTDTVEKATDEFLDKNLTMNGVSSGIASYGEVVGLLLDYYQGVLY